ncbi:hypothetical protein DFH09DRAFT_1093004 [Mycena vulgaris]|nr:hypothetical protein DFH09DRAFT_1093004 [Mycena vulgaris]
MYGGRLDPNLNPRRGYHPHRADYGQFEPIRSPSGAIMTSDVEGYLRASECAGRGIVEDGLLEKLERERSLNPRSRVGVTQRHLANTGNIPIRNLLCDPLPCRSELLPQICLFLPPSENRWASSSADAKNFPAKNTPQRVACPPLNHYDPSPSSGAQYRHDPAPVRGVAHKRIRPARDEPMAVRWESAKVKWRPISRKQIVAPATTRPSPTRNAPRTIGAADGVSYDGLLGVQAPAEDGCSLKRDDRNGEPFVPSDGASPALLCSSCEGGGSAGSASDRRTAQ